MMRCVPSFVGTLLLLTTAAQAAGSHLSSSSSPRASPTFITRGGSSSSQDPSNDDNPANDREEEYGRLSDDFFRLTPAQIDSFHREGCVTIEKVLTEHEVDELERIFDRFVSGEIPVPGKDFCDMSKPFGIPMEEWSIVNCMLPTKYYPPMKGNIYERLTDTMAQQLFPSSDMVKDYDQLLNKRPGKRDDVAYWPGPAALGVNRTDTCTFSLAIDDSDKANGCLRYVVGSGVSKTLRPHKPLAGESREESHALCAQVDETKDEIRLAPAKRGSLTIHNEYVVHGSGGNTCPDRQRRTYVVAYRAGDIVQAERSIGFTHSHNDDVNWDTFQDGESHRVKSENGGTTGPGRQPQTNGTNVLAYRGGGISPAGFAHPHNYQLRGRKSSKVNLDAIAFPGAPTKNRGKDAQILEDKRKEAFPLQTPHSGRHFRPSHPHYQRRWLPRLRRPRKRFMEGWYYRLTLPEENISFAFIISIEDPGSASSPLKLACIQAVGPDDEYLVQADRDDSKFWAWKHRQGLGYTFDYKDKNNGHDRLKDRTALSKEEWLQEVESGFQFLPLHLMGRIKGHDGSKGGVLDGQGIRGDCSFDMTIDPVAGWGDVNSTQKSTGGWLASFAVFEPHWQVTLADARATGTVRWKNKTYSFENEPFYAEKNWGKALPTKWYWTQCNSFEGYTDRGNELSVTAGGGVRQIPFGHQEALGMVSVHYKGKFYEAVPWTGTMRWKVDTWGSWVLYGKCSEGDRKFEVEIVYKVDPEKTPGLVFRAPTPKDGMVYFCKDTFEADVSLSLWELEWNERDKLFTRKAGKPLIDRATSTQGGAEVGGGPWWDTWDNDSQLKRSFKFMLQFPYRMRQIFRRNLS